ncbi:MAG TPA: HNH endonuclease [Nitrospiraceae bacterium]|nr:HNH endonuclease [Nitrospiraceae bacterium]
MHRVFVPITSKQPLMPCSPARARLLLKAKRAAVFRRKPFTIIPKGRTLGGIQPVVWQLDPGSQITGMALVGEFPHQGRIMLWASELYHRGDHIRQKLLARSSVRRGRRARKTRYRPARFKNRRRPEGWLPPSLQSRLDNVMNWTRKVQRCVLIRSIAMELVRFDTQQLMNPEVTGVEYQQGELFGFEVREYLLEKWRRTCAYCHKTNVPMEIEHLIPRSRGGSNRVGNLTLACTSCNQRKGNQTASEFGYPQLMTQARQPLKDAAAVNSTRWALYRQLQALGLPVSVWSGGQTKYNRTQQGYPKAHWIDAACVGINGSQVRLDPQTQPLAISATGRGTRQVVKTDHFGFPRSKAARVKRTHGFQTGDLVRLTQPYGKYGGKWVGPLAGVRATGKFDLLTSRGRVTAPASRFTLYQRTEGYIYAA